MRLKMPVMPFIIRPTTAHILNACPIALDQGRYTWRRDSALKKILQGIIPHCVVIAN